MLSFLLLVALQAGTAQTTVMATAVEAPAQDETAETAAPAEVAAPAAPPRKKVCRNQIDTRVGLIAKSRKVCRFVDEG